MTSTIVWASRDIGKDVIKVWSIEPKFLEPNMVWTAPSKNYCGLSCEKEWPGPAIPEGCCKRVAASFTEPPPL